MALICWLNELSESDCTAMTETQAAASINEFVDALREVARTRSDAVLVSRAKLWELEIGPIRLDQWGNDGRNRDRLTRLKGFVNEDSHARTSSCLDRRFHRAGRVGDASNDRVGRECGWPIHRPTRAAPAWLPTNPRAVVRVPTE